MKGKTKNLDLHISYSCVNNCIFCSEAAALGPLRGFFVPKRKVFRILEKKRKEGCGFVNFTGGEPTLHPDFPAIVYYAKKLGFRTYVGTNGVRLRDASFCKAVLSGLDVVSVSVHGDSAATHDLMAGRKGGFRDILAAFGNLHRFHFKDIYANIVVTRKNFLRLPAIMRLLAKHRVRQVLVSNVAPEGAAADHYRALAVPLARWRTMSARLERLANKNKMTLRFFGLPLCVLDNSALSNDLHWDPRLTLEARKRGCSFRMIETMSRHPDRKRKRSVRCGSCAHVALCFGHFSDYLKYFGDHEMQAVKNGSIA